jgi:steroid 5-alpha reductase family enzyme
MDLPWQAMGVGLALSLVFSALGFKRVVYFVSIGYAASIAAQAIAIPLLYRETIEGWALAQSALLLAYGCRLGTFLMLRGRTLSYRRALAEEAPRDAHVKGITKWFIWVGVSVLYVLMFMPAMLTMAAQAGGVGLSWAAPGIVVMTAGLGIEAWADWQKSKFKTTSPSHFCNVGLFRIVRFPNYLGEMIFWLGVWLSGVAAYQTLLTWMLGAIGFVSIELVMLGSGRRLELQQGERYAADADFQNYVQTVPVLIPLLPLYSLRNLKAYLG